MASKKTTDKKPGDKGYKYTEEQRSALFERFCKYIETGEHGESLKEIWTADPKLPQHDTAYRKWMDADPKKEERYNDALEIQARRLEEAGTRKYRPIRFTEELQEIFLEAVKSGEHGESITSISRNLKQLPTSYTISRHIRSNPDLKKKWQEAKIIQENRWRVSQIAQDERIRPTIYNEAIADELCRLIRTGEKGNAITQICQDNVSLPTFDTVLEWSRTNPEFSKKYEHAKYLRSVRWQEDIQQISQDRSRDILYKQNGDPTPNTTAVRRDELRIIQMRRDSMFTYPDKYDKSYNSLDDCDKFRDFVGTSDEKLKIIERYKKEGRINTKQSKELYEIVMVQAQVEAKISLEDRLERIEKLLELKKEED